MDVVVDNVFGHGGREICAEGRDLFVYVGEVSVRGPTAHELNGMVRDTIKVECHCTTGAERVARNVSRSDVVLVKAHGGDGLFEEGVDVIGSDVPASGTGGGKIDAQGSCWFTRVSSNVSEPAD